MCLMDMHRTSRFRKPLRTLIAATALSIPMLLGMARGSLAEDLVFTLANQTHYDLREFYASPPDVSSWEEDILGPDILEAGDSIRITISDGRDTCIYDLMGVFEDDDQVVKRKVNLCRLDTFYFTETE